MATNPSLIGQLIADRYRIEQRRGGGAHGVVFDALDEQQQQVVAVKVLLPHFVVGTAAEARFRLEAQLASSFDHPNLNKVFDWGVVEIEGVRVPFLVIEKLSGGSLRDMIDRGRLLTPSQALVVGLDACRGLDAMHRRGVMHRDLRPANLAFGDDRHAQILDVGLSRYVAESTWVEPTAAGIDAARYASPEQAKGASPDDGSLTPATDIYSLCLVLIESVTGQVPFDADSTMATLNARIDKLMPVSADFGPLATVLSKAGNAVAGDRYSAADFGRALVQAAGKLPRPTPLDVVGSALFGDSTGGMRRPVQAAATAAPASPPPDLVATSGSTVIPSAPVLAEPGAVAVVEVGARRFDPQTGELLHADLAPPPPVAPPPVAPPFDFTLDDDRDDRPPVAARRRRGRGFWVAIVLVVVAALVGGAFAVYSLVKDTEHTVPVLAGMPEAVGRNQVAGNGWTVAVTTEPNDTQPAGNIIRTEPDAGVKLAEGKTITFVVSEGPTLSALPDVTGLPLQEATDLLAANKLAITVASQESSEEVPFGSIISWTVPAQPGLTAGAEVMQSTVVSVIVSQGPVPRQVPTLVGLDEAAATAALAALQLEVVRDVDVFDPTQPAGVVAAQSVPPGTEIARGTSVTIAVSKGPDLRIVPALGGLTYAQIEAALTGAGLKVGEISGDKDLGTIADATVDGASLTPGQLLPVGTAVDLVFADPPPPSTEVAATTVPVSSSQP